MAGGILAVKVVWLERPGKSWRGGVGGEIGSVMKWQTIRVLLSFVGINKGSLLIRLARDYL